MDTTEISSLLERGAALALDLACDDDPESSRDSDTVHQLTEALRELTRWQWVRRGTGLTLCWGGRPVGAVWSSCGLYCCKWLESSVTDRDLVSEEAAQDLIESKARARGFLTGEVER